MKTLLITGGIGSGKSEACHILEAEGIPVYDADSRTKALYIEDNALVDSLEAALGVSLRDNEGNFSRKALAECIFADSQALAKLESIVHPRVLEDFLSWQSSLAGTELCVMESAIAAGKPMFREVFDNVIVVTAPLEQRIERACIRDNAPREKVMARIKAQDDSFYATGIVVENDSTLDVLRQRIMDKIKLLNL